MNKEVKNQLTERYILDLQKKELDPFDRAATIRSYMEDNNLSIRAFGKKFMLNKSTVEDWLLWNKIPEEKYDSLRAAGVSHTQIYRELRARKTEANLKLEETDVLISRWTKEIQGHAKKATKTERTEHLLSQLRNAINLLHMELDRKESRTNQAAQRAIEKAIKLRI